MQAIKFKQLHYIYLVFPATLSILSSGMHYGWPSPSLPRLTDNEFDFPVSNSEGSSVAILTLIGDVVGSMIAGWLVDYVGRKYTILLTCPPFLLSWLMIANSPNIYVLYAARFIAGLGDGLAFTAVPIYLGEIAEPKIRGLLCSSCVTIMIFGMLLINIIGSYLSIATTAYISAAVPIALIATFSWMPESPYYSIMRNELELAKQNLKLFRGKEDIDTELNRMISAVQNQNKNTGSFFDLFTVKSNRKAVYIVMTLRTIQQLSGITAFTFYAHTIFKEAGGQMSSHVSSFVYFTVQLISTTASSIILDKAGRRPLVIISTIGGSIALFVEGLYFYLRNCTSFDMSSFELVPPFAMISFVIVFSLGLQTIPILMLGELFPTNVKGFALALADVYFSILASAASKYFQHIRDVIGIHVPFFTFAICCTIGSVFSYLYIPETKGKTLEDIQLQLQGKPCEEPEKETTDTKV